MDEVVTHEVARLESGPTVVSAPFQAAVRAIQALRSRDDGQGGASEQKEGEEIILSGAAATSSSSSLKRPARVVEYAVPGMGPAVDGVIPDHKVQAEEDCMREIRSVPVYSTNQIENVLFRGGAPLSTELASDAWVNAAAIHDRGASMSDQERAEAEAAIEGTLDVAIHTRRPADFAAKLARFVHAHAHALDGRVMHPELVLSTGVTVRFERALVCPVSAPATWAATLDALPPAIVAHVSELRAGHATAAKFGAPGAYFFVEFRPRFEARSEAVADETGGATWASGDFADDSGTFRFRFG